MVFRYILIFSLLFLCLVLPLEPLVRMPKIVLMFILTLWCKDLSFFKGINFCYFIALVLFYVILGYLNKTGDLLNNIQVYLFAPFFYSWIILLRIPKVQSIFAFNVSVSIIITVLLMFIFQSFDLKHFQLNEIDRTSVRYAYNSNTNEFSFPLFNVLPFTASFAIIYFGRNNRLKLALIILALIVSFYTGRRGVFLAVCFVSGLILFRNFNKYLKYSLVSLLALVILIYTGLSISNIHDHRYFSFISLMDMWKDSVFLGHGLGAHADFIRSSQKPSSYELFYLSFLNQVGIFGILFFIAYFYKFVFYDSKDKFSQAVQYGIIGILAASTTNPYLDRFDLFFIIFIPYTIRYGKRAPAS